VNHLTVLMTGYLDRAWRIFISPVTFVGLSLLWCLDLGVGSVVAYRMDPQFSAKMDAYPFSMWFREIAPRQFPESLWVYILVWLTWLLVGNLFLCTVNWFLNRRQWRKGLGEVLVHLGFLLIFTGFVAGSVLGTRIQGIPVDLNGSRDMPGSGLSLFLHELDQRRDPDGKVLDTVSLLELRSAGQSVSRKTVRLNHPLIWKSAVIYPRGAREKILRVHLSFDGNPVGPLAEGEALSISAGLNARVERILQPGERAGYLSGPGALVRVSAGENDRQMGWLSAIPGKTTVRFFGIRALLTGVESAVQGVYDLHTDPGIRLVLYGAVILAIGTLWSVGGYIGLLRRKGLEEFRVGPGT